MTMENWNLDNKNFILSENSDKNSDSSFKRNLRNVVLATLAFTLLTWASSCESNSWESKRNPSTEMHKWTYILTEEEKLEYEKLDERLDELSKKALRYFVDRTADDGGTAVNMARKYNIPIVFPYRSKEGVVQKLAIIGYDSTYKNSKNTTNGHYIFIPYEGSKNTTIFPYRHSYSTRPVISKNDYYMWELSSKNYEEFNLSPEEYKRALDKIEEILNKEEEVIGNAANDFIDSNLQ